MRKKKVKLQKEGGKLYGGIKPLIVRNRNLNQNLTQLLAIIIYN